jgi:hypothetical protein
LQPLETIIFRNPLNPYFFRTFRYFHKMYSKKRTLNATASSSVNKKKKNAEVPETSTNKKIVSATKKIKVPVTTSLTKKVPVTTSSVEKVLAATTSAKKSKVPVNTSSVMGSPTLESIEGN